MKRYAWLILTIFVLTPLTPLADPMYSEFDEASHLDDSRQSNSQNQNSTQTSQFLAWDSAVGIGSSELDGAQDILVTQTGEYFVLGYFKTSFVLSQNCMTEHPASTNYAMPFVAKFDNNGTCLWLLYVNASYMWSTDVTSFHSIGLDSNENLFVIFGMDGNNAGVTAEFGNISFSSSGAPEVMLAKISTTGSVDWVVKPSNGDSCHCSLQLDTNDDVTVSFRSGNSQGFTIQKYGSTGTLISSYGQVAGSGSQTAYIYDSVFDSSDNLYIAGSYTNSVSFPGGNSFSCSSCSAGFVAKLDTNLSLQWVVESKSSTSSSWMKGIELIHDDEIYVIGEFYSELSFNGTTIDAGGNLNGFTAEMNSSGEWQWGMEFDCACTVYMMDLDFDSSKNLYIVGRHTGMINLGTGVQIPPAGSSYDGFVAKLDSLGSAKWGKSMGGPDSDQLNSVSYDEYSGSLFAAGSFRGAIDFGTFSETSSGYQDAIIVKLSPDYDGDQITDKNDNDDDDDFIQDPLDSCHYSPLGFKSTNSLDHDSDGCHDELEDDDDDDDKLNDSLDSCPKGMTSWLRTNISDIDNDGCMDALEDYDDDNDGFEDYDDYCSRVAGNSTMEFEKGCPDTDGDGRPDILDPFKNDPSEWQDTDGDAVGDNSDAFPLDATQQSDTDGDTYGDEEFGNAGDSCPEIFGNSTIDRYGCLDTDGDGWSDTGDDFPNDADEYLDTDGDNVPNHLDEFPFDPTQQTDSDGDGYGDNPNGSLGDVFPNDANRYADSDRDGVDDGSDAFPYDPTQTEDRDGDGMGDNAMGIGADKFPDDVSQWGDIDGDGYGDNPNGTNPDAFITDATQWIDEDGDGYGDNPAGRLYDQFPQNPTQWIDEDGDGLGDNLTGTNADPYLFDFDNDGYNDSIDPLPKRASPGDLDNDGVLDVNDLFPEDIREWADYDGDGEGDNADSDDDNDGWADTDEMRLGTDPFSSADVPVDSFEIVIPGTAVGLGAWDLIGMFGGIPLFMWIGFGFVTRNRRTAKYEGLLREAQTRDELEEVAHMWEYSLMLRMLGPHQGIRLERLRAELDDRFEAQNQKLSSIEPEPHNHTEMVEEAMQVEQKSLPSIESASPKVSINGITDGKGYEWYTDGQENSWYRNEGSNSEWQRFDE